MTISQRVYPRGFKEKALLAFGMISVPEGASKDVSLVVVENNAQKVSTFAQGLARYGYVPSLELVKAICTMQNWKLKQLWKSLQEILVEDAFAHISDYVVYKNFPEEVMRKSEAEMWMEQLLRYWGVRSEVFSEDKKARETLKEALPNRVLHLAPINALDAIRDDLMSSKTKWSDRHAELAETLFEGKGKISDFGFNLNGVYIAAKTFRAGGKLGQVENPIDLLRLSYALRSPENPFGDLRVSTPTERLNRKDRKAFLKMMEHSSCDLTDEAQRYMAEWKKLLRNLRPGDFKWAIKSRAFYDTIYNGRIESYGSELQAALSAGDPKALELLKSRPGMFMRCLHKAYAVFGVQAFTEFGKVADKLNINQILRLRAYLNNEADRAAGRAAGEKISRKILVSPRGSMQNSKIVEHQKSAILPDDVVALNGLLSDIVQSKLKGFFPEGFDVRAGLEKVYLPKNTGALAPFGAGTEFPLPENVNFLRSASFWRLPFRNVSGEAFWVDNGWNFFTHDWSAVATCCWSEHSNMGDATVFSGDPVVTEEGGGAAQLIDLNIEALKKRGIRYAVWSLLSYNGVPLSFFSSVEAVLQWGENPMEGELVEPSRCAFRFKLGGQTLRNYIAYVDLWERKLVYLDVDLGGTVNSARNNTTMLEKKLPLFLEKVKAEDVTVQDLLGSHPGTIPATYTDADAPVKGQAYVFDPKNDESEIDPVWLSEILAA